MSKQIPLDEPLSDEHRDYLVMLGQTDRIARHDAEFAHREQEEPGYEYTGDVNALHATGNARVLQGGEIDPTAGNENRQQAEEVIQYEDMTKAELVDLAKMAGVPHSGTKDEIAQRLADFDRENADEDDEDDEGDGDGDE